MKKYDITVVGGGFAGTCAAIAAARAGKKVLLLEKTGMLGGAASNCLVLPFMRYFTNMKTSDGGKENFDLVRGIFGEFISEIIKSGGGNRQYYNTEYLKIVLDRMVRKSGADVLFHSTVTAANRDGRKITSLDFHTVAGKMNVSSDMYIDTTGDAELSVLAGCGFTLGREEDNLCQPMTLCFRMSGVNYSDVMRCLPDIQKLYGEFRNSGKISNPREDVLMFPTLSENVVHFNSTRIVKLNPTDPFELTKAEFEAREQMLELTEFLKNNFDIFKNAEIVSAAPSIGVRESRMVKGEYILTGDELVNTVKFPDAIAAGNYDLDIHNPEGTGTSHYYFPEGQYYTIPYRSLVAADADNLLVAGRCISCDHRAQASIRIMPICAALGEAAGTAAAVAADSGCSAKNVDIALLQNILKKNNAFIGI